MAAAATREHVYCGTCGVAQRARLLLHLPGGGGEGFRVREELRAHLLLRLPGGLGF